MTKYLTSPRPSLGRTLRAMAACAWAIWADYRDSCAIHRRQRAFDRRYAIATRSSDWRDTAVAIAGVAALLALALITGSEAQP